MKIFAVILAAALAAPHAFAAEWAPVIDAQSLSEITVPAAVPVKAGPRDGQNYSAAEELLIREFDITEISMDIPEDEVMRQDRHYDNAFCFEHALRLALSKLLSDYSAPDTPLARELAGMGSLQTPSKYDIWKASERLKAKLNKEQSFVALVRPYKLHQPPAGELVERNWIFFLEIEGRPYWIIVDRTGETSPYVYGG